MSLSKVCFLFGKRGLSKGYEIDVFAVKFLGRGVGYRNRSQVSRDNDSYRRLIPDSDCKLFWIARS